MNYTDKNSSEISRRPRKRYLINTFAHIVCLEVVLVVGVDVSSLNCAVLTLEFRLSPIDLISQTAYLTDVLYIVRRTS